MAISCEKRSGQFSVHPGAAHSEKLRGVFSEKGGVLDVESRFFHYGIGTYGRGDYGIGLGIAVFTETSFSGPFMASTGAAQPTGAVVELRFMDQDISGFVDPQMNENYFLPIRINYTDFAHAVESFGWGVHLWGSDPWGGYTEESDDEVKVFGGRPGKFSEKRESVC